MSKTLTNRQYLEHVSQMDELLDHDDDCGQCAHLKILAQTARDLLAKDRIVAPNEVWDEAKRRWQETKYYKLWQEEVVAGRDPNKAFAERGWEV